MDAAEPAGAQVFETPLYPYRRSPDQDARTPAHHEVIVIGAGPVGLTAAIDLAQRGAPVLVLDENDRVGAGSRAICFAKRTLEIFDRLGCGARAAEKGVVWSCGRVFFDERQVYQFDLLPEDGHRRPAFVNLQQYYLEQYLVERCRDLAARGAQIEIRGANRVSAVKPCAGGVELTVETPEGPCHLDADWVLACDGANSPAREMLGLEFMGRTFEDNFLIADITMAADFPAERWFWFDPPFNRGQSALLHKQPGNVWRIDLQLGRDIDKEKEKRPKSVISRLKMMLGEDAEFDLEWISIYTFQSRRMKKFRHGRVIFCGDAAHQVSPFGARGANSGVQDADNLIWKLKLVMDGLAPETLLDSYDFERIQAADENILHSSRSTDFISPKSEASRMLRDAVLDLSETAPFARPLVNSGRLSQASVYDNSPLNGPAGEGLPERTRPGAAAADAPLAEGGWLLERLGGGFTVLLIGIEPPPGGPLDAGGVKVDVVAAPHSGGFLAERYLGGHAGACYVFRPDQHIAARWPAYDQTAVAAAVRRAAGRP